MNNPITWADLGTIEEAQKQIREVQRLLKAVERVPGVKDALDLVSQLEDTVADIAAGVEMDLTERNPPRKRR